MNVRKLDIGCGRGKPDGYIGIDMLDFDGVDIVWNLENFPWPLEDNSKECLQNARAEYIY